MNTLALLMALTVGQITVPAETAPYLPVVATVAAQMPEGAQFDGGWKLQGAHFLPDGKNRIHIWAKPGEYKLEFSGLWLHLKDVTFKDGDGNEITITSYLGHGIINESATFKVTGEPPPPPPPPLSDHYQIVLFVEAGEQLDKYTRDQRDIINSLTFRDELKDLGHRFLQVIDDDEINAGVPAKWKPWADAVKGHPLPAVALAPIDGGPVVVYPLPATTMDMLVLLEGKSGQQ